MANSEKGGQAGRESSRLRKQLRGIVVSEGKGNGLQVGSRPKISAFVWGGRVQPAPTLPFGRWGGPA